MDLIVETLMDFCKFFKCTIKNNKHIPNRTKKNSFIDVLYFCLYKNGNSCSSSMANINMYINDIIDVSDNSFIQMRHSINYIHFKQISDELVDFIYKNNNETRFIAVDGTYIPLSIELKKYGFMTSKKDTYCIGLICSLFDVKKKILINYKLCKKRNERNGLMKQINYLRQGDTLIMDRGYFSKELLFIFDNMKIKTIFRMKINSLMIKDIIRKGQTDMRTTIIYKNKSIKFRIISYNLNGNHYFLGTTIMNHKTEYFKELYWKRWSIEINFRESKYILSLNNILSKTENKIKQDIYSHNILFLISSFFNINLQKILPTNKFINTKNLLYLITNNILYLIMYKNLSSSTKEKIKKICMSLLKTLVTKYPNEHRHYERIRVKPIGKWYYCIKHEEKLNSLE